MRASGVGNQLFPYLILYRMGFISNRDTYNKR